VTSWRFPPSRALRPGGARVIRDARVIRGAEAGSPPVRLEGPRSQPEAALPRQPRTAHPHQPGHPPRRAGHALAVKVRGGRHAGVPACRRWIARTTAFCCLCTNVWMTCVQRRRSCAYTVEMLGIPLPGRNRDRAFTWEGASRSLCIQKKLELSTSHTAIHDELAEHLSQIYRFVIWRRDCENTDPRDGEPGRFERGAQAQRR
jgi:hypothetical protein